MPAPVQQRYNAKARGSVAGGSTHKKRKRPRTQVNENGEVEPIQQQVDESQGDGRGKMSTKKRKRLESYVAKKLQSEERLKTLKLLASLAPSSGVSADLASTATLGQTPFAPTSAKERGERREDRVVRRILGKKGEVLSSEGSASEDEGFRGRAMRKGKEKATEIILEGEEAIRGTLQLLGEQESGNGTSAISKKKKTKSKVSKTAGWNPTLAINRSRSSSSEFDSSASENEAPIAGPSTPPVSLPRKSISPSPTSRPIIESALGGALKKSADGSVVQPRVVIRRPRQPLGRNKIEDRDEDNDEEQDDDEDDNDEDDGSDGSDEDDMDSDEDNGEEESGDDDSDESDDDDGDDPDSSTLLPTQPRTKRSLGFKSWALQQMGQAAPTTTPDLTAASSAAPKPKTGNGIPEVKAGPLGESFTIPSTSLLTSKTSSATDSTPSSSKTRPTIIRRASVAESRMKLPILAEEQNIVEAVRINPVVIIAGETGSGKTTQVPQMLYEAGFGYPGSADPGMIAITQPRRVAAVSLSHRVKSEMGLPTQASLVAHQIRYSSTTSPNTAIKFMTDGVLLRELAGDFLLSRYSVIIVDEAHERGVNTDVLIGVLSRVSKLRESKWRESSLSPTNNKPIRPLRIIIMSATLRISDFAQNTQLFKVPPPVIHIPARQHPVTVHFSRKTSGDYVDEAFRKVGKVHERLPVGGILVFMTGQGEIMGLKRRLEKRWNVGNGRGGAKGEGWKGGGVGKGRGKGKAKGDQRGSGDEEDVQVARKDDEGMLGPDEAEVEEMELGVETKQDLAGDVDDGAGESDTEGLDTDDDDDISGLDTGPLGMPMHVLPLYSLLPTAQQLEVFQPPPPNHRLVILSTNISETSLTIPGIRYVIDTGRSKERSYDHSSGVQSFSVSWISKASASQRTGRAGRTGPGHCWRLYSSALYEDHFPQFSQPEILRMPIEGVVLQMKVMGIDQVVNFPFPTPPDRHALQKAETLLQHLGALSRPTQTRLVGGKQELGDVGGRITDLGKAISGFPVSPRFGKMLVLGMQGGCAGYVVGIVAGLSVGDPFVHENSVGGLEEGEDGYEDEDGGLGRVERGLIKSAELRAREERKEVRRRYFKAQAQFQALGKGQSDMFKLLAAIGAYEHDPTPSFCTQNFLRLKAMQEIQQLRSQICNIAKIPMERLQPPTDLQLKILRQILASTFIDNLSLLTTLIHKTPTPTPSSSRNIAYRSLSSPNTDLYIHPSSSLFHKPPPEYLVYSEISTSVHGSGKNWMKGLTVVNPGWVAELGKGFVGFRKPEEVGVAGVRIKGRTGGVGGGVKEGEREVVVVPFIRELGVELPGKRMKQKREGTRWALME